MYLILNIRIETVQEPTPDLLTSTIETYKEDKPRAMELIILNLFIVNGWK